MRNLSIDEDQKILPIGDTLFRQISIIDLQKPFHLAKYKCKINKSTILSEDGKNRLNYNQQFYTYYIATLIKNDENFSPLPDTFEIKILHTHVKLTNKTMIYIGYIDNKIELIASEEGATLTLYSNNIKKLLRARFGHIKMLFSLPFAYAYFVQNMLKEHSITPEYIYSVKEHKNIQRFVKNNKLKPVEKIETR